MELEDKEINDILNRLHIEEYEWFIDDKEEPSFCSSSEEDSIKIEEAISTLLERYKKQQKEIEILKEVDKKICNEELLEKDYVLKNYISKDKIRDKKLMREFELQQEYKDFENDREWQIYEELLEEK